MGEIAKNPLGRAMIANASERLDRIVAEMGQQSRVNAPPPRGRSWMVVYNRPMLLAQMYFFKFFHYLLSPGWCFPF